MHESTGSIEPLSPRVAEHLDDAKERYNALQQLLGEGRVPIPKKELPRVRKMNRKARRRWAAQQRKKLRSKTF